MKKLIVLACAAASLSAHAQYFNHDYGTPFIEVSQSGMNTVANHTGFVIAGIATNPANGNSPTVVSYSDNLGNIPGAPYFTKAYRVKTPTGINMNSREGRVLELGLNRAIAGEITAVDALNSMSDDIYKIMEKYKYKTAELPKLTA